MTGNDPADLLQMMTGYWISKAVYVAAKLGVADLLANGPVPVDALARMTGAHSGSLYRVLRALASVRVFAEVDKEQFALTPVGMLLQSDAANSMRALAIMYGEEQYQAWGGLLHSVRTGQPAFEHQFGMGVFEYFGQHAEASAIFDKAMAGWTIQYANAAVAAYDFSRFGTVVDIGGGRGTLLAAVLNASPSARGVLFDLPHVVATAAEDLDAAGVADRCKLAAGDFFHVHLPEGDAVMLAQVLHDWDDERCVRILSRCRSAISAGGKLLVFEMVLPKGDESSFGKWLDLHMLVMASGRERTVEEYRQLLKAGGLELTRVIPTPAGPSILEAEAGCEEPAGLEKEES